MIIQGRKTALSIPKEWMSIYEDREPSVYIVPKYRIPIYRSYRLNDNSEYIPVYNFTITNDNYLTDDELEFNTYGNLYQQVEPIETDPEPTPLAIIGMDRIMNFDSSVLEYKGTPSIDDVAFSYWYKTHSTDSETGVEKLYYISASYNILGKSRITTGLSMHDITKFSNPNITFTTQYAMHNTSMLGYTYEAEVYFLFPDGVSYNSTITSVGFTKKGSASKSTVEYTFYLDNRALKNELALLADQYTTVNLYHLDGTEWT